MNRTLLISEVFPPQTGGSGRWLWELYQRMPREQVIAAAGEYPGAAVFDRSHDMQVVRVPLALRNYGFFRPGEALAYWRAWRALKRLVLAERVTEIHCGRTLPEGWLGWLLKRRYGLPYLCYIHGEEISFARASRELTWMTKRVLSGARLLIANSCNTRNLLLEQWRQPDEKVKLLHPGVDARRFAPHCRDESIRKALGWMDRSVVLTVGRLQRRKGQDMMIRALSAIRRQAPNILYSIVGNGGDLEYLRGLAIAEGVADCVQFRGEPNDDELTQCYQQCDLFALPNRTEGDDIEGFGMVLVEAQACGKAVIAGNSGGTRDTMRVGETGLIVDCTAPEALAAAVVELLHEPSRRETMGLAARNWVVDQFDWEELSHWAEKIFAGQAVGIANCSRGASPAAPIKSVTDEESAFEHGSHRAGVSKNT